MSCQNELLIHAYLDGELDLKSTLEVEAHLKECSTCAQRYEKGRVLHAALCNQKLYFNPPEPLAGRIRAVLGTSAADVHPRSVSRRMPWSLAWALANAAASVALIALIIWQFSPAGPRRSESNALAEQVIGSHVRSLMPGHLADVPSSDQHTVKPWFDGKLDFAPPVIDLAAEGFPLEGGRLDYLNGRPVAALVYQRRKHIINLFVWPSSESMAQEKLIRQGYNLIHWTRGGMEFWAVSDLNDAELAQFARLVQSNGGSGAGPQRVPQ